MDAVQTAVRRLDAVRLSDGRYAYYAVEAGQWWIVSEEDVRDLGRRLAERQEDAYSLWCAESDAEVVDGLDHDTLDAIVDAGGGRRAEMAYRCQCGRALGQRCRWVGDRDELVHVRWVPESERGSARASGTYSRGGAAVSLYVHRDCAQWITREVEEGELTDREDPYARVVGPAYVTQEAR